MHPIEAIQNYKAGQQLKAALKPVAKSPIGATEIGFDANQGKAVIDTEDGGQLYTRSITNGYRGPGQAVRVDRDGSVIQSDSMPRPKVPVAETATPKVYGKLKILYIYNGALWIGGDRRIPKRLNTNFTLDSNNRFSFNNLGDGDKYILSGFNSADTGIETIAGGKKALIPNGLSFTLTDSAQFKNLFLFPGYFSVDQGFGHGLFVNNLADLGASAKYWDGINHDSISNPDYYYDLVQDSGSGNWWIAPGVSKPVLYIRGIENNAPYFRSNTWGVHFASKNLDSIGVWSWDQTNGGGIRRYIYRRKTGQLDFFGMAPDSPVVQQIGIYDFPNWVGSKVYSTRQATAIDFQQGRDRQFPIAIAKESPGNFDLFEPEKTIKTPVYRIPKTAVIRAYSYHP
jgi:hypothetical protein